LKVVCSVLVLTVVWLVFATILPLRATGLSAGEMVFNANCSVCHIGGNNIIMAAKSLKKEALEQHGMNSLAAVKQRVELGHHAMPAFGKRLSASQIEVVAAYILQRSNQGW
jgi:cytochrome c6